MKQKLTLKVIGARIRCARIKSGMTLQELQELSGLAKGNLSKIEHGGNPTVHSLILICAAIGIEPAKLFEQRRP
jgi:transcriptional regulator with XRE-family HTH domain